MITNALEGLDALVVTDDEEKNDDEKGDKDKKEEAKVKDVWNVKPVLERFFVLFYICLC